jgi:CheY-like chemotaxis protein
MSGLPSQPILAGLTVLVVEDSDDSREVLQTMLESSHMKVLDAASVDEALLLLETEHVDVIVSDIGMPEKDGYFFIRHVRASIAKNIANIPALALTAFATTEVRARAMMSGFNAYMTKPPELMTLLTRLARMVEV